MVCWIWTETVVCPRLFPVIRLFGYLSRFFGFPVFVVALIACSGEQNEVVAVDEFRFVDIAENGLDLGSGFARNKPSFAATVIAEPTGDFPSVRGDTGDYRAAFEFTFGGDDADRQQAFSGF